MATEKRLIDANALIKDWNKLTERMVRDEDGQIPVDFGLVIRELSKTPTVDAVEVVHGRFMYVRDDELTDHWECSVCHGLIPSEYIHWNYCPRCGAKMDGDGNVDV